MRPSSLALSIALGATALAPAAHGAERLLTVEEAVDLALKVNARVLAAQAEGRKDHDLVRQAGARMLPVVTVTEEADHYNNPFDISFASTLFRVRDQNTNAFVASAEQPLLGLLHLSHERGAQERACAADEAAYAAMRADLKASVQVGYLQLFEARALEQIAKASEGELAEEMQVTRAKVEAGVLTNADVLRVQVAMANARQQEILAQTQGAVARADMLGALGFRPDEPGVDFAEPTSLLARGEAALPQGTQAQQEALASRPEIAQHQAQVEAADHDYQARRMGMLPDVNAEANYTNLAGQKFSPPNAAYVGVRASWPIWEWGASFYAQRAAGEHVEATRRMLDDERQQVRVEVVKELSQAQAADSAVEVAQTTIASAEEAFRVTGALLKAGSATTTDLLDAQAALTQARLTLARAQYDRAIARVNLSRALGR